MNCFSDFGKQTIEERFKIQLKEENNKLLKKVFKNLLSEIINDYQCGEIGEEFKDKTFKLLEKGTVNLFDIIDLFTIFKELRFEYDEDMKIYNELEEEILKLFNIYLGLLG
ncbi:hypothetical protein V1499_11165 [Neobacillus sp. SCS-31]|uniref:hypothetical protein n=1 Tax=Neobacillus oceani TaxID=3115292 RepID=UPI003906D500